MIDYKIDLSKPYLVVDSDQTHVVVEGCSRTIETTDGKFGGVCGTWRVPKVKLLNKEQRRALHWKQRIMGKREADKEFDRICAAVIAEHSNSLGA